MSTFEALYWFWVAAITTGIAVVVYTLIVHRLAEMAQPLRLRMVDSGRALLESDLPEADKRVVRYMLAHAFSGAQAWMLVLLLPFFVAGQIVVKMRPGGGAAKAHSAKPPINHECLVITGMFVFSIFAANPLAAFLLMLEMITFGFAGLLVGGPVLLSQAIFAAQSAEARGIFRRFGTKHVA